MKARMKIPCPPRVLRLDLNMYSELLRARFYNFKSYEQWSIFVNKIIQRMPISP
jgi:hypothetical protein